MDEGAYLVGGIILIICVAVQTIATVTILRMMQLFAQRGYFNRGSISRLLILEFVAIGLLVAFLLQIVLWALLFMLYGQFGDFQTAFYFSAVNYTTLGYGDIILSDPVRILGPLEAANGLLMGGLAASVFFSTLSYMFKNRNDMRKTHTPDTP